jgi:hypothetical protein
VKATTHEAKDSLGGGGVRNTVPVAEGGDEVVRVHAHVDTCVEESGQEHVPGVAHAREAADHKRDARVVVHVEERDLGDVRVMSERRARRSDDNS